MTNPKGKYTEDIAQKILSSFGFKILEQNYFSPYGEVDIIASKHGKLHFIEVKSSYGEYNPAENFHQTKLKRFIKTVRLYCYTNNISEDTVEIDLALINMKTRRFTLVKNANLYFY